MLKLKAFLLIIILCSVLSATEIGVMSWESLIDILLNNNSDYQQLLYRYNQEKAKAQIEKSLSLFDVNFSYQYYDNDIERDETETVLEESKIKEEDERYRVELNRQFFPKDFDASSDNINYSINLLRYEHELAIGRSECLADIFDDMIDLYEALEISKIQKQKLEILYDKKAILDELQKNDIVDIKELIENLEDIDDLEEKLADQKKKISRFMRRYDGEFKAFLCPFQSYIEQNPQPDSILFKKIVSERRSDLIKIHKRILRKVKINYYKILLPEVELSLSYNWRNTDQDWDITKNNNYENRIRNQSEEYPEGEIEFSLPFNIFSNSIGKHALLRSYEHELEFRFKEIDSEWFEFGDERVQSYLSALESYQRKNMLKEFYNQNFIMVQNQFMEEPSILGTNPEMKYKQEKIRNEKADLEFQIAEMKLFKEIYIINRFGEKTE